MTGNLYYLDQNFLPLKFYIDFIFEADKVKMDTTGEGKLKLKSNNANNEKIPVLKNFYEMLDGRVQWGNP